MFYHALTGNGGTTPTEDLEPVLLWENSNPSAEFAGQTISLDLTDYAGVLVEFERSIALNDIISRAYIKKDDYNVVGFGAGNSGGYGSATSAAGRSVKVDNNGVVFGNGYSKAEDNSAFIPVKIYGVKSYVVEPVNNLQYITSLEGKTISFNAEENVAYLLIETAFNGSGSVYIRECSVDNGELVELKHAVQSRLETYTALIKNAVGTVNYSSKATSDGTMILIFKLMGD